MCRLKLFIFCLLFAINATSPSAGLAATYYVDPNGTEGGSGTLEEPYHRQGNGVLGVGASGDTVYLLDGYYGIINTAANDNAEYITVSAYTGNTPEFKALRLTSGTKWKFIDLTISPETAPVWDPESYLVSIGSGCNLITIEDCSIYSVENASSWSLSDWEDWRSACNYAVNIAGPNTILHGITVKNVYYGITALVDSADNITIEYSTIEHFSADGIVICCDNPTIQYNTIKNSYKIDGVHTDAMQFHRGAGTDPIYDAKIVGNTVLYQAPGRYDNGISVLMDGIVDYDVPPINWYVANNVVAIDCYNGLNFNRLENSIVINNTVVDKNPSDGINTWIGGVYCKDSIVRNNIAKAFTISGTNITSDHNIDIDNCGYDALFVDYLNNDFRHKSGSPAIDSGSPDLAPDIDIVGTSRFQGKGYDLGAYEYVSGPLTYNLGISINGNGSVAKQPDQPTYSPGTVVILTATPDNGNTFDSWGGALSGSENPTTITIDGHKTVTANFREIDVTPPSIVSVSANQDSIKILFSEPLDVNSATDISNYSISPGIIIYSATLEDDLRTVILETSDHAENVQYTLTGEGVKDLAGNSTQLTTFTYEYTPLDINAGMVGYWKFDEGSGSTAVDASGTNNTGTLVNGAQWTDPNGEISFDGINDAVEIGTSGFNTAQGTITLWAKGTNFAATRYLFGHTVGAWNDRIQLYVDEGNLGLGLGDSHTKHTNIQTLNVNIWYHIALTWDGTNYVVYVNGQARANGSYPGLTALSTSADIGNTGNASYRDQEAFDGIIDEVRIYNRALTVEEISNLALVFLPIGDKTVDEGSTLTFQVRTRDPNIVVDINDHNLPSDPCFFYNGGAWSFSWTPTYGDAGTYEADFVAPHDQFVDHETITVTVNDANLNSPPVSDAGPDQTVTDIDGNGSEQVTLDGSGSTDPDGTIVSYVWTEGASQIATGLSPTVTLAVGAHTITLTVTDDGGLSDTDTVIITVNPGNSAPVADAGPDQTVTDIDGNGSEQVTLDGSGSTDSDGTITSYVWTEGASQIATGVSPAVTLNGIGAHTITLTVTDSGGLEDADEVIITVKKANGPPKPEAIPDKSVSENSLSGTVSGSYTDTHVSDDIYESIQEIIRGKNQERSGLVHKWIIDVTGGDTVTFYVEAQHTANTEGDDFTFAYSTDDSTYTDMLTVTKTVDDDTYQSFQLPSNISGNVYIRLLDTDRLIGNTALDTIHIDHMYILSEAESTTWTLTIQSSSGGSVNSPGEGDFDYNPAEVVPLEANADTGYYFVEWTGDTSEIADPFAASTTITMDADHTIQANFALNQRSLDISSTAGGSVTSPGEGDFDYNPAEVVPIEANADTGYYFVEWTGDTSQIADPFAASTTITMDADYTIQANFAILLAGVDDIANGETSSGTISGSYTDTYVSDDAYESVQETIRGRNQDRSGLVHKWTIDVTGGDTVTFYVEAHHTANTEGDDFTFAYSTDGSTYTDMFTVTKTFDDNTYQSYQLPSNISGTVYIRMLDTDRLIGNTALNIIYIDHMYIRSESGG